MPAGGRHEWEPMHESLTGIAAGGLSGAAGSDDAATSYQALVEQIPIVTYTESLGATKTLTYLSPQVEALLGYTPEEALSRPEAVEERLHPGDREVVAAAGARSSKTGEPFRAEYRIQARDGRWLHVRDEAVLVRDDAGRPLHWQGVIVDVTEQRRTEAALRRAEARYRELFDDAPVMYVLTRNESGIPIIDDCNALFLETMGYAPNEVIGRSLADLYAPASREALLGGAYAAALQGTLPPVERSLITRDGREITVLGQTRPEAGADGSARGTRITYIDISKQKATELALLRSVERAEALMESALDCVIVADGSGRIVQFNSAAETTFGYRRDEAIGQPVVDLLVPSASRQAFSKALETFLTSGAAPPVGERHETTAMRADGSPFPIELTIATVAEEDGPLFVGFVRDISGRVAAEAALRASEERFRGLVQGSHDIITVIDRDGICRYASPSIEDELGYRQEELLGANVLDQVHPDDAQAMRGAMASLLAGANRTRPLEVRLRHNDGGWRVFETIGTNHLDTPHLAGIVLNSREITWRKATEAALRESEARFRAAFDYAPIGLMIFGPDGEITQVNRSLCILLRCQEGELVRMRLQQIAHPDDLADAEEQAKRLFAGEIASYGSELRLMRKDGSPVWAEMTVSAVSDDDRPHRAIAQIQDITGRRNLDIERATMLASERAYTKRLRELASLRADFSAMVAHELRTPIASLRMMIATLETGALPPDTESEMISAMQGQIEQLNRLVNDVAAAATVEHADFSVQLHPVPLPMLISGVASAAAGALADHPLSVGPVPDRQIWCDPERISQVLGNLVDNAAKHTPPGTPISLRSHLADGRVRIEVADRGPGIASDDLTTIFEKFGRGRQTAERQSPGLGLGLYLSSQIVHAHGAELTVEVTPEGETVFAFDLRVAR